MNQIVPVTSPTLPALVTAAGERAGMRFLEFFAANIRNPHTRRAYARAADEFLAWCASAGVPSIFVLPGMPKPPELPPELLPPPADPLPLPSAYLTTRIWV
jgi:hypothetical protein